MNRNDASSKAALLRAVENVGSQTALAKAIGVPQSTLSHWLLKSRRGVPAEWVSAIEAATGVPRHELRPDLYAAPSEDQAA